MGDLLAFPGVTLPEPEPVLMTDSLADSILDISAKMEALFEAEDTETFNDLMRSIKEQVESW